MKICSYCEQELPDDAFHRRSKSKDGLAAECKRCRSEKAAARYAGDEEFRTRAIERSAERVRLGIHKIENRKWYRNKRDRLSTS